MKKIITFVAVLAFTFSSTTPASASSQTLTIENVATVTFPTSVKLVSRGCQTINVKYTAPNLDATFGYIAFAISNADDQQVGGFWLNKGSLLTGAGPQLPTAKRLGTVKVKVCRNNWASASDENKGIRKKGTYEIWFTAVAQGEMSGPDIYSTITFK